jgi:hypothetical protein
VPPCLQTPAKRILGAWRLVRSVEFGPGGETRYPLGEDAIGCIIYIDAGVMAVQIGRRARAPIGANAVVDHKDYLAYFGRYWLDRKCCDLPPAGTTTLSRYLS